MNAFLQTFLILLVLLFGGCGTLYLPPSVKTNIHSDACGPRAIYELILTDDRYVDPRHISHSIRHGNSNQNTTRDFLGFFSAESYGITFPEELRTALEKYGYKVVPIKDKSENLWKSLDMLVGLKQKGIVLIQERSTLNYHYMAFPSKHIRYYYGADTDIIQIFVCERIKK
jgi:hypothetical protein